MLIYKIFRRPEWDAFRAAGETLGAPIDLTDGYIHFSTSVQVAETAAKFRTMLHALGVNEVDIRA